MTARSRRAADRCQCSRSAWGLSQRLCSAILGLRIPMRNPSSPTGSISDPNACCSCNCTGSQHLGMDISELQFVQIILIMVVMVVMVVLIICLLNHYKFSGCSGMTRQSQGSRQEEMLQQGPSAWPQDSTAPTQGASEAAYAQRERLTAPAFMQQDRFCRFQPTYPPQQHQIDLPPTICLSDGEEPPPYQGPCTLQLRDPEQQMELSRESVRAPPNRTVFDSDLIAVHPPSSNSGISASRSASHGHMEGPPPTYSEVMGKHPASSFFPHQHGDTPPILQGAAAQTLQHSSSESTTVPIKIRDSQRDKQV
ncbi:protein TMEPAI-like isoform X1 [Brienomyrus brachyistius]|uniref:protein TMEPAI-like isoform X1 n=2 Tax=Brienomyrus brachyistius TaxID=42636 RepID=UPI0020B33F1D|nr:protein TMEPAI-like isoform X1 [Brienomyrus brachyistius]